MHRPEVPEGAFRGVCNRHLELTGVFRAPDALPGIAAEAVQIRAGALWCQFGVVNAEGARIAEAGNVPVVMDRCLGATVRQMGIRKSR